MPLVIKDSGGGNFEPAPAGTHAAVCTQIIDMGIQEGGMYGAKHRLRIAWEIGETMSDGKPFVVSQMFTVSLNEKAALRKTLESWRGKSFTKEELAGFDLENVLGKPCLINVIHETKDERTYANIASISPLPKGMEAPKPAGELLIYSCDAPDRAVLEKLPEWLSDKVMTGEHKLREQQGTAYQEQATDTRGEHGDIEDTIPF